MFGPENVTGLVSVVRVAGLQNQLSLAQVTERCRDKRVPAAATLLNNGPGKHA